jgi:amino acid transporter
MMKRTSIIIIIIGVAITIACLIYFRPALNPVDSDTMTVNPQGIKTSEWPLFIGLLTTFVGICFFFISLAEQKKAKR